MPNESFEIDPYAALRPAMSREHAELPINEVTVILGRMPARLVLHQLLNSAEIRRATLASLLGHAARRSVRFNGSDVSIPSYLRMVSRLAGEVAEETEAPRPPVFVVPQAPKVAAGTTSPDPRPDGIDIFGDNAIPSWADIRAAGVTLVIHKSGEGVNVDPDRKFLDRYRDARANGFIRGSYHYYRHTAGSAGSVQADKTAERVHRLGPGDLAPALDFEEDALSAGSPEPATAAVWRTELEAFLDTVETKLGRIPLIYTRTGPWRQHLTNKADFAATAANFNHFGDYPLWVVQYCVAFPAKTLTVKDDSGNDQHLVVQFDPDRPPKRTDFTNDTTGTKFFRLAVSTFKSLAEHAAEVLYQRRQAINTPTPQIPAPWGSRWFLYQYSQFTPLSMRQHHNFADLGVDLSIVNGGIHVLRGAADLGHTAPHLVGHLNCIVYSEPDGRIHLVEWLSGSWVDDVANSIPANPPGALPLAAGDPAAAALGNEQVIAYRSPDGSVHALTRNIASSPTAWQVTDLSAIGGSLAFADPCILVFQNAIHVVYWDQDDAQVHVSRVKGKWQPERFVDRAAAATPSRISGSAASYVYQNALHVVSRSQDAGHLFDFTAPNAAPQDLTAAAHDAQGHAPPAATYRPATYTRQGQAPRIVFRALRGHIWQIERDTLTATDLSAAANAPNAAGKPTAVVVDTVHILYRGIDGRINEIFDDRGTWRTRAVCTGASAASDPSAYIDDRGNAAATFRKPNGAIHIARFVNGAWTCEDAI